MSLTVVIPTRGLADVFGEFEFVIILQYILHSEFLAVPPQQTIRIGAAYSEREVKVLECRALRFWAMLLNFAIVIAAAITIGSARAAASLLGLAVLVRLILAW